MYKEKGWSIRKWKNVIWSDESRFTLFKTDGPGRVWRTPGTRYNIENISPTVKRVWYDARGLKTTYYCATRPNFQTNNSF